MQCLLNDQYAALIADSARLQFLIHNRCTLTPDSKNTWRIEKPDGDGGARGFGGLNARDVIDHAMWEKKKNG